MGKENMKNVYYKPESKSLIESVYQNKYKINLPESA